MNDLSDVAIQEAIDCAYMCKFARLSEPDAIIAIKQQWPDKELKRANLYSQSAAQAFVVEIDDTVFVVWRGTEFFDFRDLAHDLDIRQIHDNRWPGKVHSGFRRYFDKLSMPIYPLEGVTRHIVTGHSLGAAAATLHYQTAWLFDACYLFGSPRVGNAEFAKRYSRQVHRFSILGDPVTSIPTIFRWRHIGDVQLLTGQGIVSMKRWRRVLVSAKNIFDSIFTGRVLRELSNLATTHAIDNYIEKLEHGKPKS